MNCENQPSPCEDYNKCQNGASCSVDGNMMMCDCPVSKCLFMFLPNSLMFSQSLGRSASKTFWEKEKILLFRIFSSHEHEV